MKISKIYSALLLSSLSVPFFAHGQDLSTEVVVDRTVETYLPDAKPLKNVFPELIPAPKPDMALKAADYSLWADFNPLVQTGKAPDYTGIAAPDKHRGYAWLGYFPAYNLGVAAGYRFVDKERTRMGASVNFDGMSYNNRFSDSRVGDNAFKINLFADHWLKNGLKFGAYAYYSFDGLKNPGTFEGYDSQTINNFYIRLSASRSTENLSYYANLDFRYFGLGKDITPVVAAPHEQLGRLKAGALAAVSDGIKVGADVEGDILGSSDNMALGAVTPKVVLSGEQYEFNVGLRLDLALSVPGNKFHIAPQISGVWHFMPQASLYGEFKGGNRLQTMYNLYCYSPFASGATFAYPTYSPVDGIVGVRLGAFSGFKFDVFGGWSKANRTMMPVAGIDGTYASMSFVPTDISGWHGGLGVAYSYSTLVDAALRFNIGPEGIASDDGRYFDRAKYSFDFSVRYKPSGKLAFDLRYNLRGGRRYGIGGLDSVEYNMGAISDLGLGATWKAGERVGMFLRLDNILNKRSLLLPGLSCQGFHGLLGVDFRF